MDRSAPISLFPSARRPGDRVYQRFRQHRFEGRARRDCCKAGAICRGASNLAPTVADKGGSAFSPSSLASSHVPATPRYAWPSSATVAMRQSRRSAASGLPPREDPASGSQSDVRPDRRAWRSDPRCVRSECCAARPRGGGHAPPASAAERRRRLPGGPSRQPKRLFWRRRTRFGARGHPVAALWIVAARASRSAWAIAVQRGEQRGVAPPLDAPGRRPADAKFLEGAQRRVSRGARSVRLRLTSAI